MATLHVRADDLDRMMAVMDVAFDPAFGEAWSRRQVEDALLVGNCQYLIINPRGLPPLPGEEAVGFALSRITVDEEELLLFAVAPDFRGLGLGRCLLGQLETEANARGARRIFLEMRDGNSAEHLYRNCGFIAIGRRPNYYRLINGERRDAITFARDLDTIAS